MSETAWLQNKLNRTILTNQDRYGMIRMVYGNGTVFVKWANGLQFTVGLRRLQHVPLADYFAALSTPADSPISTSVSLRETVLLAQQNDPTLCDLQMMNDLDSVRLTNVLDEWRIPSKAHVFVRDELVYFLTDPDQVDSALLCIPPELRQEYLKLAHDSVVLAGHRSASTSFDSLKVSVYWPFMESDMVAFRVITGYGSGCYKIEMVAAKGQYRIASAMQLTQYHSTHDHFLPGIVPGPNVDLHISHPISSEPVDSSLAPPSLMHLYCSFVEYQGVLCCSAV
jgi:hypothetical protein